MKKFTRMLYLILTVLLISSTVAYATETSNTSVQKDINVPVKYICENKGGEVSWDAKTRTAVFKFENKTLQLKMNSNQIVLNGKAKTLGNKVTTIGGRAVLPLSVLNRELGLNLTNDDYLKLMGIKFWDLLKEGQTEDCSGLLSQTFSKYLSPTYIKLLAASIPAIQFDYKNITLTKNTVHQNLIIPCVIQQVNYNYIIRFDYDGKIDEMSAAVQQPQYQYSKPSYDNSDKYTEQQVSIGSGAWKLPGTLTMPKGKGPFPVVILVHGSGPDDRDESVGALKPFRDLAVGLAAQNIAVLRYEKRTLEHSTKMQLVGNFTMKEEFELDAFAAAEYLKTVDGIDSSNITVLGHSQGGYILPRIMNDDKSGIFKAGIIMSGCSRPIYELLPEQYEYLGATSQQVEAIKAQVKLLEDPGFDPANPPSGYSLGTPYYFYDMKTYDVLGAAKAIEKPMLVLQGERDYQVSPKTDFEGWKKAFDGKQSVDFKLYPKLNHMYTEGDGKSSPAEYYVSSNIPQYVIDDIAAFVNKAPGK